VGLPAALDPTNPNAYHYLALALNNIKRWDEALQARNAPQRCARPSAPTALASYSAHADCSAGRNGQRRGRTIATLNQTCTEELTQRSAAARMVRCGAVRCGADHRTRRSHATVGDGTDGIRSGAVPRGHCCVWDLCRRGQDGRAVLSNTPQPSVSRARARALRFRWQSASSVVWPAPLWIHDPLRAAMQPHASTVSLHQSRVTYARLSGERASRRVALYRLGCCRCLA